jgi:hypothetical protein
MMADRPKLLILDDPLRTTPASSDKAPPPQPSKSASRPKRAPAKVNRQSALGREPLQAVFGRVPKSLARRLEGAVYELRGADSTVRQQQVLAALLWRHVDPADEASLKELAALVDEYKCAAPTSLQDGE